MSATTLQTLLTKILINRINSQIATGTISSDTDIQGILDEFVASDKITLDEYNTLVALISNAKSTTTSSGTTA